MSVTIEAVLFNHDPAAASQDALNLRRNASGEVRLPEWQEGVCVRPDDSPAAYSIADTSGHTITIKARFRSSNPNPHTVEIRAVDDLDDPDVPPECRNVLGQVHAKKVAFAGGQSGLVEFELRHVRLWDWGVGARETTWFWQARDGDDDDDEWERFATTRHRVYSVLRTPTAPWQQAPFTGANTEILWADVLDYACWWAFGAKTADTAACGVTRHVYDLGPAVVTYDCPGRRLDALRAVRVRLHGVPGAPARRRRQRLLRQLDGLRDDHVHVRERCRRSGTSGRRCGAGLGRPEGEAAELGVGGTGFGTVAGWLTSQGCRC
jgi:hypothetical protein